MILQIAQIEIENTPNGNALISKKLQYIFFRIYRSPAVHT